MLRFLFGAIPSLWFLSAFAQNVGIGTLNPQSKLHVVQDYEIVRLQGTSPYIGFYNPAGDYRAYLWSRNDNALDIGTRSASNLPVTISPNTVTQATFHPNGNLGLGVSDPGFRLDVLGRMRLRHGGETAGIWFNNSSNTAAPAFVGLVNDNTVGLYGNYGGGWAFQMHATNGHIGIGGAPDVNAKLYLQAYTSASTLLKLGTGKVVAEGAGVNTHTTTFVHKATAANSPGTAGYTVIDNVYCNGNPQVILQVTMNGTYGSGSGAGYDNTPEQIGGGGGPQIVSTTSFMVVYNGPACFFYAAAPAYARDKWIIRTYSGQYVGSPLNFNFNVTVVNPN